VAALNFSVVSPSVTETLNTYTEHTSGHVMC
jgi:hypothetical protein